MVETKVTKRSSESPQPGAPHERIRAHRRRGLERADGRRAVVLARRLRAQYRWEPGPGLQRFRRSSSGDLRPDGTGFADLAGATPW